jgi:hypothetical protein
MKEYIAEYIVPVFKNGRNYELDLPKATPLIRCKDCKHVGTDATLLRVCNREGMGLRPFHVYSDDYCSYAESKEEQ